MESERSGVRGSASARERENGDHGASVGEDGHPYRGRGVSAPL